MVPEHNRPILLECCIASVDDAIAAEQAGVDRLELNLGLELGGLTPSVGLLQQVLQAVDLPVLVMIRPRAAGFCYSPSEQQVMLRDAESLLEHGASGIVAGALTVDRRLDVKLWQELRSLAANRTLVFHRAFDTVDHQFELLEQLVDLRTDRILTSGGQATAPEGAERIAELVEAAGRRIEILPGSGISAENVVELLQRTKCCQVHGSFSCLRADSAGVVAAAEYPATSIERVRQVRERLDSIS